MKYSDGTNISVSDRVLMDGGITGTVVCSIDDGVGSEGFSIDEWKYLKTGIIIQSDEAGIIHYKPTDAKNIKKVL